MRIICLSFSESTLKFWKKIKQLMRLFRKYKKKTLRIVFCFSPFYTYICWVFFFCFFPILPKRRKNKANMLRSFLFWIAHLSNSFAIYGLAKRELMLRKRKQTQRKGWFIHAGMTSSLFDHSQHFHSIWCYIDCHKVKNGYNFLV